MDNRTALYREEVPLRLRQAAIDCLRRSGSVRLCVDPGKTDGKQVAFFVRTPEGKPNRRHKDISPILKEVVESRYQGKVEAKNNALFLAEIAVSETKTSKKGKTSLEEEKSSDGSKNESK